MANNLKFSGWSGITFDISKLNVSGRTQSSPQNNSKFTAGPVVINKDRPKKSTLTPGVKQPPVAKVNSEPKTTNPNIGNPNKNGTSPRKISKLNLESTSLPFTAGTIDTSFPNGVNTGFDNDVYVSKIQSDGKILVGGSFDNYYYEGATIYSPYLIRLNSDGSPDFDFDYTYFCDDYDWYLSDYVRTIDIQSDGKILIGGDFNYIHNDGNDYYSNRIMRFNSNGSIDDTLFVGDGFNDSVSKIIVQPDSKILVGGLYSQFNNNDNWRIIRLNSNGTQDFSFDTGNGIDWDDYGIVNDMVLQPNGKIILGGDFYNYDGNTSNYIVRINSNGSYDNTFVLGEGFNDVVNALALQSDGKIIVGGVFDYYNNIDLYSGYIVRLGTNGEMDTRFGEGFNYEVRSLYVQSDDKILIGGELSVWYVNGGSIDIDELVRFHSDCTLDYGFAFDDTLNSPVNSITLDSDDKIYIGGEFYYDTTPFLLNYFGRINNSISEYPYTYTFEACAQPLIDETIIYMVGSMTPLEFETTYSLQSLQNPSITVCGYLLPDAYPSNIIEYVVINSYVDCEEAYTSNYKLVLFDDCLGDFSETPFWVVDNRFEIGDIFYVDSVIQEMGIYFVKFAATIVDVLPWSGGTGSFGDIWYYIPPVNYVTYSSCDEAIEANGLIYEVYACSVPANFYPLIHKAYYDYTTILVPIENSPVNVISNYLPIGPYEFISGGTPEIYSTIKIADGEACELGLSKISPEGLLNYNFNDGGFGAGNNFVYTTVEQPDGKLLVGGNFEEYDGQPMNYFMRLDSNGNIDETFNTDNSKVLLDNPTEPISIIKQQGYIFTLDHGKNVINVFKIVNNKMVSVISNYNTNPFVVDGFPWQIYGDGTNLYIVFDNAGIGVWKFITSSETLQFITKTQGHFCEQYSQIWGDGDYIYASTAPSDGGNQTLKAFQLNISSGSSGNSLDVVGEWGEIYTYNSVYCQNGYIFVGVPFSGLYVVTFNGTNFTEIISIVNIGDIVAVNGDGTNVYVVDGNSVLKSYYLDTSRTPVTPTPTPTNTQTPTPTPN